MSAQRPLTPDELLAMPDDAFKKVVDEELRPAKDRKHPEGTSQALRSPVVLDRLYHMLIRIQRNTESQLAAWALDFDAVKSRLLGEGRNQGPYMEAREEYATRRARTIRFKSSLDMLIQEVKFLRSNQREPDTFPASERERLLARITELESAIRTHRDGFPYGDEPGDADIDLWALATPDDQPAARGQ